MAAPSHFPGNVPDLNLPDISVMPGIVQDLHAHWDRETAVRSESSVPAVVRTWFVDHQDSNLRACHRPRHVRLTMMYDTWEAALRQEWRDYVSDDDWIDYFIVTPSPPTYGQVVLCHVLLVRHRHLAVATSVLSLFDQNSTHEGPALQVAISTLAQIHVEHILRGLGIYERCCHPRGDLHCDLWHDQQQLQLNRPLEGINGLSLEARVRPRSDPPQENDTVPHPTPGFSLLQRHATITSTTTPSTGDSERLTDSRMAFNCRPLSLVLDDSGICEEQLLDHSDHSLLQLASSSPPVLSAKLGDDDVVDGQCFTTALDGQDEQGRPELRLGDHRECLDTLREIWNLYAAAELEEEGRVLYITTWFSNPGTWPKCTTSRPVRLLQDIGAWLDHIAEAWDDRVDPDQLLHFYMLQPQPRANIWDNDIQPHVLLVQQPVAAVRSIHFSIFDARRPSLGLQQHVDIIQPRVTKDQVLHTTQLLADCVQHSTVDCMVWWGDFELRGTHHLPLRDGYSLFIIANQLPERPRHEPASSSTAAIGTRQEPAFDKDEPDSSASFLQTSAVRSRKTLLLDSLVPERSSQNEQERLTGVPVAHTLRPCSATPTQAVRVHSLWAEAPLLPSYIEIAFPGGRSDIQEELGLWGHDCEVLWFATSGDALCLHNAVLATLKDTSIYISLGADQIIGPYHVTHPGSVMSDTEHMRFLYKVGFWRAVIVDKFQLGHSVQVILFEQPEGQIAIEGKPARPTPVWPAPMPLGDGRPMFAPSARAESALPSCVLRLGVTAADLRQLFDSSAGLLHTNFDDIGLDLNLFEFLVHLPVLADQIPDRYIVYVDGSSQGHQNHRSVEWIEEQGVPDAWAMIVLAEIYQTSSQPSQLFLVGWTAQQVRYNASSPFYLGASHTGATVAEREGLTWALLWRVGINSCTPTLFRSDSQLSCNQAVGITGTDHLEDTFLCLRGAYQLLEAALPQGHLEIEHIYGHSGEPFNDFTDFAAKSEAQRSHFLPRPPLNMTLWRDKLPYLWMIFGEAFGCPPFHDDHFDAHPPDLPPESTSDGGEVPAIVDTEWLQVQLTPSFCTANVLSMYSRPDGFAGKLGYLVEPFQAHALIFGGLQEARTPAGSCRHGNVQRFCSGAVKGQGGVLEATPRLLLARITAPFFDVLAVVGHAPHSGRPEQERSQWWQTTTQLLLTHAGQVPLFVMIDANAAPGEADNVAVFQTGLDSSRSTPLWRAFLEDLNLALPQTTAIHQGGLHTWTSLDGSSGHCLDYIAVPVDFVPYCTHSQLLTAFDLGNDQPDHAPLAVELRWTFTTARSQTSKSGCPIRFDRSSIRQVDLTSFLSS
eukprot:s113_g5.t2